MKVNIISGFLGTGKTTLIKYMLDNMYKNEKIAIVENEFGELDIDSYLLEDYSMSITKLASGCICCSIAGDFKQAINELKNNYDIERIVIEPSGVAKLSDVIEAIGISDLEIEPIITLIDKSSHRYYIENFADFYKDQILNSDILVINRFSDRNLITKNKPEIYFDENLSKNLLEKMNDLRTKKRELLEYSKNILNEEQKHSSKRKFIKFFRNSSEKFHVFSKIIDKEINIDKLEIFFNLLKEECKNVVRVKGYYGKIKFDYSGTNYEISELKKDVYDNEGKICIIYTKKELDKIIDLVKTYIIE